MTQHDMIAAAAASAPAPPLESRRLELLFHISRELSRRIDLRELIERILRLTSKSIGAETGSLILVDEAGKVYDGALFIKDSMVANAAAQLGPQIEQGLAGWVVRNRRPAFIKDTVSDSRWRFGKTQRPESKAALAVPLLNANKMLGVLTLVHPVPNHFTENDEALITAIAEQAGVAVENARLFRESQQQTQAMRTLLETAQVLSSTLEPNRLLRLLLSQAQKHLHLEAASISLIDRANNELYIHVATGNLAAKVVGRRLKIGQGIAGWVAESGQSVIVPDVQSDSRFFPDIDQQTGFLTRTILCAPIQFEGHTIGVIEGLNPGPGTLDKNTLPLLTGIASIAGNAIAHAQQFSTTQAAKTRYAGLFEDSFDSILITDLNGRIIDANHKTTETFGYNRLELVGKPIRIIHRTDTGPLRASGIRELASGTEKAFTSRFTAKDGHEVPVDVHAKRISTPDYEFIQWIARDISERVQFEELQNDLFSMIYHDLRSPLGNVVSSLSMMETTLPEDDALNRSAMEIAVRATQRISRLTESLLDVRRLESGNAVLTKEDVSIESLANEAAELVRPIATGKGLEIKTAVQPGLPPISADAGMLSRVIVNLIENAVKYTPGEGTVTIAAHQENDMALVSIIDAGPGIPEEARARVFDKFTRLHGGSGAPKGLGLGLAFCKLAVEAHGGRIWADAGPGGKGSSFNFTLPLKK